jgi:hypothetical protein
VPPSSIFPQFNTLGPSSGFNKELKSASVSKRKTHTIVERAKIILLESGLPMGLWSKVIIYIANYVLNQSPS